MKLSIIILMCILHGCGANTVMLYKEHTQTTGKQCQSGHIMFSESLVTLLSCTFTCVSTPGCLQVFYDSSTQSCMGCSTFLLQDSTLSSSQLYVKQHMRYVGCFADAEVRTLDGHMVNLDNNGPATNERCSQICHELGFPYSGTEITSSYRSNASWDFPVCFPSQHPDQMTGLCRYQATCSALVFMWSQLRSSAVCLGK